MKTIVIPLQLLLAKTIIKQLTVSYKPIGAFFLTFFVYTIAKYVLFGITRGLSLVYYNQQTSRMATLLMVIVGIFMILILRLAYMQIMQGAQYKKTANENSVRRITTQAPRGSIYDRSGAIIVTNRPSFSVAIIPSEYTNPQGVTPFLSSLIGVTPQKIDNLVKKGQAVPYTPVHLKRDIDAAVVAQLGERKRDLPGVVVEVVPIRQYVYNSLAAHLLGYVGAISDEEYEKRQATYGLNDFIGKDGIEQQWEQALKGIDGGKEVEVNAQGEELRVLGNTSAIAGKSLYLTLDANLQKVAEDALNQEILACRKVGEPAKGGAVVMLEAKTGKVLVLASSPAFDLNSFASGITAKDWNQLINNPDSPLTNKAIQNIYPPGSVFKIVTAAAALDSEKTTTTEIFDDRGAYSLNGWKFYGWEAQGLGKLTISDALIFSSDPFFYEMGNRLGVDLLASYARTFGLGQKTNIELSGEEVGCVPTAEWKQLTYNQAWYPGETLIAAIGQGYYLVTPLQQAMLLMAVANKGIEYQPIIVDHIVGIDGTVEVQSQPVLLHKIYLAPEYWSAIQQGLRGVTTRGTAATVFQGFPISVYGKTGSAETGRGTTHSWFACYAPGEQPQIVVAVLVEEGGEGTVAAAPVAKKILEAYFAEPNYNP
jgi:penicillin-binding protein 2